MLTVCRESRKHEGGEPQGLAVGIDWGPVTESTEALQADALDLHPGGSHKRVIRGIGCSPIAPQAVRQA